MSIDDKLIAAILAAVIVGIIGLFFTRLRDWLFPRMRTWWSRRSVLLKEREVLQSRLDNGLRAVAMVDKGSHKNEGNGLWLAGCKGRSDDPVYYRSLKESIPIWVFANLKGGVTKTTNATNIAGHYALQIQDLQEAKPILLVDLDSQGSASSMALSPHDRMPREGFDSFATRLIRRDLDIVDIVGAPSVRKDGLISDLKFRIVPAYYDLAQAENRIMIEWLFGDEPVDVRYSLVDLLHNPVVQNSFSRILIDAPPRLTTACVQALCSATIVIIPTVLDRLSGEAVFSFIKQIEILREAGVCPHIEYGGIIGYRSGNPADELPKYARDQISDAEDIIRDALCGNGLSEDLYIKETVLTYHPLLAESAGQYIATLRTEAVRQQHLVEVREMFMHLAVAIEKRVRECKRG